MSDPFAIWPTPKTGQILKGAGDGRAYPVAAHRPAGKPFRFEDVLAAPSSVELLRVRHLVEFVESDTRASGRRERRDRVGERTSALQLSLHANGNARSVDQPTLERPFITYSILVVEDDPLILMTAAEALRAAGFNVIEVETADEAAAILRAAETSVGVVFSDIETPGTLNGLELASVINDAWPSLPVVLTSGRVEPCPLTLPQGVRFIPKPYDPSYIATLMVELGTT